MLRKLGRKLKCQKGTSELIGLMVGLPFVMSLFISFVMFVQMGMVRQSLEQAAYTAARAAVVQPDKIQAQNAARTAAGAVLSTSGVSVTPTVNLFEVAGVTDTGSASGIRWEKGSLVQAEVTVQFPAFGTRRNVAMKSDIVMMIERPAPNYAR
jgi:Flp pilus assembly protein TadG